MLKLAFTSHLRYARNSGFRTANFSLPFKVLEQFSGEKKGMARFPSFEPLSNSQDWTSRSKRLSAQFGWKADSRVYDAFSRKLT